MIWKLKYTPVLLGVILCANNGFAQKRIVDSLTKVLNNTASDTARMSIYSALYDAGDEKEKVTYGVLAVELADKILEQTTDKKERKRILKEKVAALIEICFYYSSKKENVKAFEYLDENLKAMEKAGDKDRIASILRSIGRFYFKCGIFSKALEYNLKALPIYQDMEDTDNIAQCVEFIGDIYKNQGNDSTSLQYGLKAVDIAQKMKSNDRISIYYSMVSERYSDLHDTAKFHEYALKALKVEMQKGNKEGIAQVILGIGEGYIDNGYYEKGLEYIQKSLSLWNEIGDKNEIAYCLGRIAKIYRKQNDYPSALEYYFKAYRIYREINTKSQINYSCLRIGEMYLYQFRNYNLAKAYLDSAIVGTQTTGQLSYFVDGYNSLADLDSLTGDYKAEARDYKKYIFYRDSLKNEMTSQQTVQVEMNYELNQLDAKDKAEQAQKDIQAAADKHKETMIIWSVVGGLLLVLVFAGFVFRSLRITRKQKQLIEIKNKETEEQKKIVEEKSKSILDSITYAKRLQDAIIPPISLIKKYLPESFVLYKPKDIVAGDFYWMERAGDNILIAAADCTGHGVPGALVSVVCSNALNRTVKEFHITQPGKILDKVRELVLETFEKSESNVQDGMDISLCCLNTKTNEMQWSGAYNSLWYIQNGEMKELPADKQPIGKVDKPQAFNTYNLNLQKGDTLYLFTDGYADQFGGPKGKKFKYKQFQEVLTENAGKTMEEQMKTLDEVLNEWKGTLEQVDDILVIGIKV